MFFRGNDPRADVTKIEVQTAALSQLLNEASSKLRVVEHDIARLQQNLNTLEGRVGNLPTKAVLMWGITILTPLVILFSKVYCDSINNAFNSKTAELSSKITETFNQKLDALSVSVDGLKGAVDRLPQSQSRHSATKGH